MVRSKGLNYCFFAFAVAWPERAERVGTRPFYCRTQHTQHRQTHNVPPKKSHSTSSFCPASRTSHLALAAKLLWEKLQYFLANVSPITVVGGRPNRCPNEHLEKPGGLRCVTKRLPFVMGVGRPRQGPALRFDTAI
jgi:hypothetical protein